jgi:hypothetical protein
MSTTVTAENISKILSALNAALIFMEQSRQALTVIAKAQAENRQLTQAEWDEATRLDTESSDRLAAAIAKAEAEGR